MSQLEPHQISTTNNKNNEKQRKTHKKYQEIKGKPQTTSIISFQNLMGEKNSFDDLFSTDRRIITRQEALYGELKKKESQHTIRTLKSLVHQKQED